MACLVPLGMMSFRLSPISLLRNKLKELLVTCPRSYSWEAADERPTQASWGSEVGFLIDILRACSLSTLCVLCKCTEVGRYREKWFPRTVQPGDALLPSKHGQGTARPPRAIFTPASPSWLRTAATATGGRLCLPFEGTAA